MLRKLNNLNGKEIAKKKRNEENTNNTTSFSKTIHQSLPSITRDKSSFGFLAFNHLNISLPLVLTSHDIQTSGLSKKSKTKTCQNRKILSPEMDEF